MLTSNYSVSCLLFVLLTTYNVNTLKPKQAENQAVIEFVKPTLKLATNKAFLIKKPDFLMVSLSAFGSHFILLLFPTHEVYVKTFNESSVTRTNYTHYSGRLEHRPNSKVYGYLHRGVFVGAFVTPNELYYIEPNGNKLNKTVLIQKLSNFETKPLQGNSDDKAEKVKLNFRGLSPYKNKICNVRMNADHTFARSKNYDKEQIIGTLHMLIMMGNDIFVSQDFDGDGQSDKFGLRLGEVRLYLNTTNYRMADERLLAGEILYRASIEDADDVNCLDFWVTNRDLKKHGFEKIKGLSFRGGPSRNAGVCSKKMRDKEGVEVKRNKGLVNIPIEKDLHPLELVLSFVHELGHAFGANHTQSSECKQTREGGYYIMASPLVSFNEQTFTYSECDRKRIHETLIAKGDCFVPPRPPVCGDGIVDDNEECDCGLTKFCRFVDACCNTRLSKVGVPCKRKPNCLWHEYCAIKNHIMSYHGLINPICKSEYQYFVKTNR